MHSCLPVEWVIQFLNTCRSLPRFAVRVVPCVRTTERKRGSQNLLSRSCMWKTKRILWKTHSPTLSDTSFLYRLLGARFAKVVHGSQRARDSYGVIDSCRAPALRCNLPENRALRTTTYSHLRGHASRPRLKQLTSRILYFYRLSSTKMGTDYTSLVEMSFGPCRYFPGWFLFRCVTPFLSVT